MFWWNGLKSFKKKIILIRGMFFFSVDINFMWLFFKIASMIVATLFEF